MLHNKFRKFIGILILVVFGVAVIRFAQQTAGNQYVGGAVASGLKFLLFLILLVFALYRLDRRLKKRQP